MVNEDHVQSLAQEWKTGQLSRRDFLARAAALGFSATAIGGIVNGTITNVASAQDLKEIPRENTVIASRSSIFL